MLDQVNVDKHPALADLGARNLSGARLLLQRYRMDVQERGGGLQIERVHARPYRRVSRKPYRPKYTAVICSRLWPISRLMTSRAWRSMAFCFGVSCFDLVPPRAGHSRPVNSL